MGSAVGGKVFCADRIVYLQSGAYSLSGCPVDLFRGCSLDITSLPRKLASGRTQDSIAPKGTGQTVSVGLGSPGEASLPGAYTHPRLNNAGFVRLAPAGLVALRSPVYNVGTTLRRISLQRIEVFAEVVNRKV